jgi:hypothetical protein
VLVREARIIHQRNEHIGFLLTLRFQMQAVCHQKLLNMFLSFGRDILAFNGWFVKPFKSPSLSTRFDVALGIAVVIALCVYLGGHALTQTEWLLSGLAAVALVLGWLLHDILGVLRSILEELRKR